MSNDIEYPNNPRNSKVLGGMLLLGVGVVLLLKEFILPDFITLWPLWLVGAGLVVGARSDFGKPSSFTLIVLGVIFLFTENIHNSGHIFWPLAIIAFGMWMILRRHHKDDINIGLGKRKRGNKWDWNDYNGPVSPGGFAPPAEPVTAEEPPLGRPNIPPREAFSSGYTGDDYLDTVSVFGGVKKAILSKDFKGGEVVNIFGGAQLDFIQADINGRVILDITQIFGGTKIIIPSHWQVVSDIAAVFGSIDDKRMRTTAAPGTEKILVLKGVSIFAGVDIRSY